MKKRDKVGFTANERDSLTKEMDLITLRTRSGMFPWSGMNLIVLRRTVAINSPRFVPGRAGRSPRSASFRLHAVIRLVQLRCLVVAGEALNVRFITPK